MCACVGLVARHIPQKQSGRKSSGPTSLEVQVGGCMAEGLIAQGEGGSGAGGTANLPGSCWCGQVDLRSTNTATDVMVDCVRPRGCVSSDQTAQR